MFFSLVQVNAIIFVAHFQCWSEKFLVKSVSMNVVVSDRMVCVLLKRRKLL